MSRRVTVRHLQNYISAKEQHVEPELVIPVKEAVNAEKYHIPGELR